MALIKCVECGKEISDKAEKCPHCGCRQPRGDQAIKGKLVFWVCGVGIIAVVIGCILFVPALIEILKNMNNWYFWNWGSQGSDAVRNMVIGGILECVGAVLCNAGRQITLKPQNEEKDASHKKV